MASYMMDKSMSVVHAQNISISHQVSKPRTHKGDRDTSGTKTCFYFDFLSSLRINAHRILRTCPHTPCKSTLACCDSCILWTEVGAWFGTPGKAICKSKAKQIMPPQEVYIEIRLPPGTLTQAPGTIPRPRAHTNKKDE